MTHVRDREARMKRLAVASAVLALVSAMLIMPVALAKTKHHAKAVTAASVYKEFVKAGLPVSGLVVYTAALAAWRPPGLRTGWAYIRALY